MGAQPRRLDVDGPLVMVSRASEIAAPVVAIRQIVVGASVIGIALQHRAEQRKIAAPIAVTTYGGSA